MGFGHQSGEKYFLVDLLAQRVPQLLRTLVLVGTQPLVLVRQDFHESVSSVRQVQQMLNRSLCANFVAAELPEHLLLVVVRLNSPAELVELERVNRHMLGAGVAEPFVLLPSNAHVQGHRIYGAEKETVRAALAQRYIGMDSMVAKDARFHQTVINKIVIHPAKVIREIIGNLVQHQAFTVLWWMAATACRRIRQLEHGRIVACIADHVEIRIAESMLRATRAWRTSCRRAGLPGVFQGLA